MSLFESFEMAIRNIFATKMRAFLTMLGIIIGVTAVIVIVGLGNGMQIYMTDSFQSLGTNTLSVTITGRGSSSRSVSVDDMYGIVFDNPDYLDKISPTVPMMDRVKIGNETSETTSVTGVGEDYFDMKQFEVASGRGLQYIDMTKRHKVCVIGSYLAGEWFGGDAVGRDIKIGGNVYSIVGVLSEESESEEGGTDDAVYIPYSTAARLSSTGSISSYTITVVSEDTAPESKSIVENALFDVFGDEDAYNVMSMVELLDMMTKMLNIMITVLAVIAGISLVVGGIGIMNIMLVSVSERTKEIGIRKALGAKEHYILTQFVIEAATTSMIGGAVGIAFGYGLSAIATKIISAALDVSLPVTPSSSSVFMAFGISAAIGILFGYLPAKKASVLNPIDALRYE